MTYFPGQSASANDPIAPLRPMRRRRPGADDREAPLLFWLTMLVLGCVSLAGMTWGASNALAQKGSEKLLRVDLLLPKLKSIQWERKAGAFLAELSHGVKALPKERNTTAPHTPPPPFEGVKAHEETLLHGAAPDWNRAAPTDRPLPPIVETCDEPAVYLNPCTPQRGDSPMMRTWKTLSMYSLLAATAVTLAPPPLLMAGDDNKEALDKLSKEIKALTMNVQALTNRIGQLESRPASDIDEAAIGRAVRKELKKLEDGALADLNTDIKAVKKRVDGIKDDISSLQAEQLKHKLQIDNQKAQIEYLTDEVSKLNKKVVAGNGSSTAPASPAVDKSFMEELRSYLKKVDDTQASIKNLADAVAKLGGTKTQTSMSPPIKNDSAPSYGRIVFNNMYSSELLFIVNGINYRVPAQTRFVLENVPAGTVRYEVVANGFGSLKTETITLAAGRTERLEAVNRP